MDEEEAQPQGLGLSIDGGPTVPWLHIQEHLSPMGLAELRAAYWEAVAKIGPMLVHPSTNGGSDVVQ